MGQLHLRWYRRGLQFWGLVVYGMLAWFLVIGVAIMLHRTHIF